MVQAVFGSPSAFGFTGILTAAAVVFFAYTGFEAVANMSEEARIPARHMAQGSDRHAGHRDGPLRGGLASCWQAW